MLLPPNEAPLIECTAIPDWLDQLLEGIDVPHDAGINQRRRARSRPGYALFRSTLRGIRVPKAGGDPEPFDAKYFDVVRKKSGGGWEFTRRLWSCNLKE